jgi:UDP-N-acetylmuramoyl-L-alanyl-D-glutamate--2,6-diaminopimelate ligase
VITIGILGSRGKSSVAEIVSSELKKQDKQVFIIGTEEESTKEFIKLLYSEVDYAIIEISREDLLEGNINKIKFDIVIQTSLDEESKEIIQQIQNILSNIKEGGYIIFSSDSIQNINFKCDKIYPITYGLNGRTTVTASSIDDREGLCFSYCLQRAIFTLSQTLVQPCEIPIQVEGIHDDVGYYLAAYTCLIVLGFLF